MLSRGAGQARSGQPHAQTAHICEHQRLCRFRFLKPKEHSYSKSTCAWRSLAGTFLLDKKQV